MTHITLDERKSIKNGLDIGASIRQIANQTGRPVSTISREIKRNSITDDSFPSMRVKNRCIHRTHCSKACVCQTDCHRKCSICARCNAHCPDYCEEHCPKLDSSPFVCNGCAMRSKCVLVKRLYLVPEANQRYRSRLVESRSGFNMTEQQLMAVDALLSPLIRKGHSLYHIALTHPNELPYSKRTLYRLVHSGSLTARNIDMPRVCRLKLRSGSPKTMKIDKQCRIGRTIQDYRTYCAEHSDEAVVQVDSVVGTIGGKVLLTLHLTVCDFMIAFLRDANTAASVISCFDLLRQRLESRFSSIFSILLTDNGTEFSNPAAIEHDDVHIFYCDPYTPTQKPQVERNHEFIRKILPSGTSFDHLTQEDINLMMSHINSYGRKKLGGKSPAELLSSLYGEEVLHLLWHEQIPADSIVLKPSLLKR